ncbi:MAG: type II secretion system protein GspD [Planctomycetes bacterium]|nr:type II secretion system protein GspD [Planctomycetota bacterium]
MNTNRKENKKRFVASAFVWLVALVCLATLVVAQEEPLDSPVMVLEEADYAAEETTYVEEIVYDVEDSAVNFEEDIDIEPLDADTIQTLTLKKDMSISDALRFLALKYQKNIVPTEKVAGNITVTDLYDVTFEEALQALIGTNQYDIQGNFIMVYTAEEYEQIKSNKRRMEYKIFSLNYLTADEALKLVTPLLSADGMVATSSPAETGVPAGESISSDSAGGDNLAFQDTLVVKDYPETIVEAEELIKQLDVRPRQVLIEATILSATLTEDMEFGVDLNLAGGADITPAQAVAGTVGSMIEVGGFANSTSDGLKIGIRSGDASIFINALEEITDTTIMANPKILAVNKQLGQVYIGTKLGYREADIITDGGATQEGSVKFLDTGTKLSFRPYIGDDGYIRMQIHPKDSTGSLNAQGVPDEISTELATNIIVKDGQTVVIGGLFRDKVEATKKQVPVLGSIPIIGELFKGYDDQNRREEVIVLLTPHIIDEPEELNGDDRVNDLARKRLGARDGLLWAGVGKRAEDSYSKAVSLYADGDSQGALCELQWTLNLRPNYLEAMRLRDRIIGEAGDTGTLERIMIDAIEQEEADKWFRY